MTKQMLWFVELIRIMSIENLQRESSTAGSKHHQLQGVTVEQNASERVLKPRQISGAGHRKLSVAQESHEESSTKSGHPPGTPSDYLRRRVLPMDNESSSPHEQYVAGNNLHVRPDSSGLTSAQLQLQRQHQSL